MIRNTKISKINKYIIQYPYYDYNYILENIEKNSILWGNYSKLNHNYCKKIYDNCLNKKNLLSLVKNDNLCEKDFKNCLTILKYYSPFTNSSYDFIRNLPFIIENYYE